MKTIYLDFDGTVVEHAYPKIGEANPNAIEVVKKLQSMGYYIYLNTMRCEFLDNSFQEAIEYLIVNGITKFGVTRKKIYPPDWSERTNDIIFIDDIAKNIPLIPNNKIPGNMVDWKEIERLLITEL